MTYSVHHWLMNDHQFSQRPRDMWPDSFTMASPCTYSVCPPFTSKLDLSFLCFEEICMDIFMDSHIWVFCLMVRFWRLNSNWLCAVTVLYQQSVAKLRIAGGPLGSRKGSTPMECYQLVLIPSAIAKKKVLICYYIISFRFSFPTILF